jgi:hypothetical protein
VISATFQHALSTLTAICFAVIGVLPHAALGDCCCESKRPARVAACSCQTKTAKSAHACCASKAAKTAACAVQRSDDACRCDACHCRGANEPAPVTQPRSDSGPRFEAPVAALAPAQVISFGAVAATGSHADMPVWLPRPVRERYCVWVI